MTQPVPASEIERIVGAQRHATRHIARAVSDEQTVYILHSARCRHLRDDLRECPFSLALDNGIDVAGVWADHLDKPVRVARTRSGRLIPVAPGMKVAD